MSLWAGVSLYYLLLVGLPITAIVFIILASVTKKTAVVATAIATTALAITILVYYRFRFRIQDFLQKKK
jgi:phosphate starvation-inducible membrane PsiE